MINTQDIMMSWCKMQLGLCELTETGGKILGQSTLRVSEIIRRIEINRKKSFYIFSKAKNIVIDTWLSSGEIYWQHFMIAINNK